MALAAGGLYAVALLLAGAGTAKVARPEAVTRAIATARLPGWSTLRRLPVGTLAGLAEITAAAAALAFGNRVTASVVATAYLVFAAVAWRLLRVNAVREPCGCFGETVTPVSAVHVVVDLAAAAVAIVAAVRPPGSVLGIRHLPLAGVPFLVGTATLAWLLYLTFTALPALLAAQAEAARPARRRPPAEQRAA